MNLKEMIVENFLAIGKGVLDFAGSKGMRLIEGINHDSPSSISNGSGKSAIPEAVQWALFGTTRRGLKGDEVINRTAGKNCAVELAFDDYQVGRYRKHDAQGTNLKLWQYDGRGSYNDISKGTVKETQALLETIIQFSEFTYSKVAYFGQGDIKGFAGLTDSELKNVFDQALGVTYFGEYLEKAKAHRHSLESDAVVLETARSTAAREIEFCTDKIEMLDKTISEEDQRLKTERQADEAKLAVLKTNREALQKQTALEIAKLEAELKTLAGSENERIKLVALNGPFKAKLKDAEQALYRMEAGNARFRDDIKGVEKELNTLHVKIGQPCGECGKVYEAQDLEPARVQLDAKLELLRKTYKVSNVTAASARENVDKLRLLSDQLAKKLEGFDAGKVQAATLRTRKEGIEGNIASQVTGIDRQIAELDRKLAAPFAGSTAKADKQAEEAKRANLETERQRLVSELDTLQGQIETAKMLEEVMGNGGLKSYVFDAITPELNKAIDKNIKVLDDIDIEVSTVSKLKSGEFREKFNIKVDNHHGAEVFAGNSGGEQQKINLAISLAFNTVLRGIAGGTINCIWLDECFENMDEGSSEKVLDLIGTLSTPNVFLITHRQGVKELIPDVITVEKRGGVATVH